MRAKKARAAGRLDAATRAKERGRKRLLRELRRLLVALRLSRLAEDAAQNGVGVKTIVARQRYRDDQTFAVRERTRRKTNNMLLRAAMRRGSLSVAETRQMLAAATNCVYCSRVLTSRNRQVDHIVPLSRGGEHEALNVVIACQNCNARKHHRTPLEWVFGVSVPLPGRRASGSL